MPSSQDSPSREYEEEDFRNLSQLEGQRKEAGEIVQKWFRFRARRGLGVFYCLLSSIWVLGDILSTLFKSNTIMITGVSVAVVFAWIFSRMAGLSGFSKMTSTLGLLKSNATEHARNYLGYRFLSIHCSLAVVGVHICYS